MMLYLALILIRPQDYPAWADSIPVPVQQIALGLAAVLWMVSRRKTVLAPQGVLLLLFLLVMMFSKAVNGWVGGAIPVFRGFAPAVLVYFLLANAVSTRSQVVTTMTVFALCGFILALHGIGQSISGIGWTGIEVSKGGRIQYVGIFNDPNDLGMLFVMCVPMAAYLAGRGGWMGLKRLFWATVVAVLVYGIYLTDSRGTLLALVAIFGIYVWLRRGVVVASILGVIALVGMMLVPSRLQDMEVSEESAMDRVYSWYEGMQMFREHPIFGVGAGSYTDLYQLTAHNSLVLALAELGFVGFTLWVAFMGYTLMMLFVAIRPPTPAQIVALGPEPDPAMIGEWRQDRAIAIVLLLAFCGFIVTAFFLSRTYVVTLYAFVGLVVAHYSGMRLRYSFLPEFSLMRNLALWPVVSAIGAVTLYIVVRVLLAMS